MERPRTVDLDEMFGEGWYVTLAPHPLTETLRLMGVANPVPCPEGLNQAAHFLEEHQGEGTFVLGRDMPGGWTLEVRSQFLQTAWGQSAAGSAWATGGQSPHATFPPQLMPVVGRLRTHSQAPCDLRRLVLLLE